MEASFYERRVRSVDANLDKVEYSGFGIATEFEYRPEASGWKWGLKAGDASGADPTSNSTFGGFMFNRNYDVAMLLFNHPLGQDDFLRTRSLTGSVYNNSTLKDINTPDVEALSNTIYFAPVAKYAFNDHWSWDNSLITGWLNVNPIVGQSPGKGLGYEWDSTLIYSPRKGVAWINQLGMLFPGQAWTGGSNPDGTPMYGDGMAYGIGTKAAISF